MAALIQGVHMSDRKLSGARPALHRFMQARMSPDGLFGRHFSIGAGVFVSAMLAFAGIALHVSSANWITDLDLRVSHWFNVHGGDGWTRVMFGITHAHDPAVMLAASAVLVWWLRRSKDRLWFVAAAGATFGGMLLNFILKLVFRRARPVFENPLVNIATYSFPSGHTVAATVFYGALTAYLLGRVASTGARIAILATATALVALVGLSRIYLGAHYLSDVVGAMLEGLAWLSLCLTAAAMARRHADSAAKGRNRDL
jgi:undecaprenyl-diphosphatase